MTRFFLMMVLLIGATFAPAPAQAGWVWDFFFPTVSNEPDPSKTLRAPFANEDAVLQDFTVNGDATTPLHLRHRTSDVIIRWIQMTVPSLLSYKGATYEADYGQKIKDMSKVGAREYVQFLNNFNYLTTLKTGRYDVNGFIENYPIILNEGAIDGHYRWLFQADVMVTFVDSDLSPQNRLAEQITKEYTITFQVGRSAMSENEHGILIETWDVKPKKE